MEIPPKVDDYIKECIDLSLGLPVCNRTLRERNLILLDSVRRLTDERIHLRACLKSKDESIQKTRESIEKAKAEAILNAQAVKRCIENNEKLVAENHFVLSEHSKLEKECSLYEKDREILTDFANDADHRATEANLCVSQLEEELKKLSEDLQIYKSQAENLIEEKVTLSNNMELLKSNLRRAEEEVKILDDETKILKRENRRLRVGGSGKCKSSSGKRRASSQSKERNIARKVGSSREVLLPLNFNTADFTE